MGLNWERIHFRTSREKVFKKYIYFILAYDSDYFANSNLCLYHIIHTQLHSFQFSFLLAFHIVLSFNFLIKRKRKAKTVRLPRHLYRSGSDPEKYIFVNKCHTNYPPTCCYLGQVIIGVAELID